MNHFSGSRHSIHIRPIWGLSSGILLSFVAASQGCSNGSGTPNPGSGGSDVGSGGEVSQSGGAGSGGTSSGGEASGGAPGVVGGTSMGGEASGGAASGGQDAGGGTGGEVAGVGGSTSDELPLLLSETGLYSDIVTQTLAQGVRAFEPQFKLWTDDATKRRWIYLPEGEQVDTADMDNWEYPVGTRLWKDFTRDGVLIETRYMARLKTGGRGWKGVAYIWNEDHTEATSSPDGEDNVLGTEHDVPNEDTCKDCHADRADWALGFSAVMLSHDGDGVNMASLQAENLLTVPLETALTVPGTPIEREALGYLHANCGHCHRKEASGEDRSNGMMTWLLVSQLGSVEQTDTYTTIVNQGIGSVDGINPLALRVHGGDPGKSELARRTSIRNVEDMMPPMGTEIVDPEGVQIIENWINSLDPP